MTMIDDFPTIHMLYAPLNIVPMFVVCYSPEGTPCYFFLLACLREIVFENTYCVIRLLVRVKPLGKVTSQGDNESGGEREAE